MKTILNTMIGLFVILSVSAYAQAPAPSAAPAAVTPTPAAAPAATAPATKPAIANADVVCEKGEKGVARATGENVTAFARCGKPVAARKPAARKPVARKPAPAESSVSYTDEPSRLRESALEIGRLRLELAKREGFTSSVTTASSGTSGGLGSTFETIKGGDRECVVYFNGVRITSRFVWGDSVATKQACDVFASTVYNTHMQSAMPAMAVEATKVSAVVEVSPAPVVGVQQAGGNNHTCELKYNGKVVETTKTADDAACKLWTDAKAKEKGWVAAK